MNKFVALLVFLMIAGLGSPSIAAPEISVHCAELSGRHGQTVGYAWFEVLEGSKWLTPTAESHARGHYPVAELKGKTVSCKIEGHIYAFGLNKLNAAHLSIDGNTVWRSDEAEGSEEAFLGTVRVMDSFLEICQAGPVTDIGDYVAAVSAPIVVVGPTPGENVIIYPDTKPEPAPLILPWTHTGRKLGCTVYTQNLARR